MQKKLWIIIFLTGTILRFVSLSNYPAGFTPDEASFSYNAYSLLKTGRDEWGTPFWQLPVTGLKSFGDYKLPLYSFLAVPGVKIFGLNEFSARLPNALLGSLAILAIYALLLAVTKNNFIATFSAFFVSLSPWAVPLSRGAFEANLAIFFIPFALALLFRKKTYLSILFFVLGVYSYHTARLIIPPLAILAFWFWLPRAKLIKPLAVFILLLIPAMISLIMFNPRSKDISILSPADGWKTMADSRLQSINSGVPGPIARLMFNKPLYVLGTFVQNYRTYFSSKFLFTVGAGESTYGMVPGSGLIYWLQLPLLIIFLYRFIKSPNRFGLLLLLLLFISPVPAALTKGAGLAANRTAPMLIALSVMSGIGAWHLRRFSKFIIIFTILNFTLVAISYLNKSPLLTAKSMGYGWQPVIGQVSSSTASQIRVSRSLSEPHAYYAFYAQMDPKAYQSDSTTWPDFIKIGFSFLDQYDGYYLGKVRFGDLKLDKPVSQSTLFIGRKEDFPDGTKFQVLSTYPDSTPAIVYFNKP